MKSYTLAVLVACSLLTACGKSDEAPSASGAATSQQESDQTATSGTFKPSAQKAY